MGYTTEYSGELDIEPPLPAETVAAINEFCTTRHDPGYTEEQPSIWCDWEVQPDGASIGWNGTEKSYMMDKWLPILIRDFIEPTGSVVNGAMEAQGEDMGDRWTLVVTDNVVTRKEAGYEADELRSLLAEAKQYIDPLDAGGDTGYREAKVLLNRINKALDTGE